MAVSMATTRHKSRDGQQTRADGERERVKPVGGLNLRRVRSQIEHNLRVHAAPAHSLEALHAILGKCPLWVESGH